jgi:opacity protein-like surface antigen
MKAFTITNLMIIVLAGTLSASRASAQDAPPAPPRQTATSPAIEVTPFVSMDSRGASPIGAAISFPLSSTFSMEAEVRYRHGEGRLNALSSSANLLYTLPRLGRTSPYLTAGAGLAQHGAPIVSREGSVIGTEPRITFEVNAGGGVKVPVDDTWGMRTDARWFKSFGRYGSEHWRVAHGVSFDVRKR